jgi:hypothetical protein
MAFTVAQFNVPEPLPGCPFTRRQFFYKWWRDELWGIADFGLRIWKKPAGTLIPSNPQSAIRNLQSGWGL